MKPADFKNRLKGVLPAMPTPFTSNDDVDVEGLKENVRYLIETGKGEDFLLVCCTSIGEFYALSQKEQELLIKTVVDTSNGQVPVISGSMRAGTKEAIRMTKMAQDIGVDGVMITLPYYHIPDEETMYKHYTTIADNVDIGVIIYNNPSTAKCYIKPELMTRLVEHENIVGVKENFPGLMNYYWMRRFIDPAKAIVFCGWGELYYMFWSVYDCPGFFTILANFAPKLSLDLYKATNPYDHNKVRAVIDKMEPFYSLYRKVAVAHGPSTSILPYGHPGGQTMLSLIKKALEALGLSGGHVRSPIGNITKSEEEELRIVLKGMGLPVK